MARRTNFGDALPLSKKGNLYSECAITTVQSVITDAAAAAEAETAKSEVRY